jgi:hypothetical protein
VAGECNAGSPGSGGASPYLRRAFRKGSDAFRKGSDVTLDSDLGSLRNSPVAFPQSQSRSYADTPLRPYADTLFSRVGVCIRNCRPEPANSPR